MNNLVSLVDVYESFPTRRAMPWVQRYSMTISRTPYWMSVASDRVESETGSFDAANVANILWSCAIRAVTRDKGYVEGRQCWSPMAWCGRTA